MLLDQLSKTHPPKTESDKIAVATEAAEEINQNPKLQGRVIRSGMRIRRSPNSRINYYQREKISLIP